MWPLGDEHDWITTMFPTNRIWAILSLESSPLLKVFLKFTLHSNLKL